MTLDFIINIDQFYLSPQLPKTINSLFDIQAIYFWSLVEHNIKSFPIAKLAKVNIFLFYHDYHYWLLQEYFSILRNGAFFLESPVPAGPCSALQVLHERHRASAQHDGREQHHHQGGRHQNLVKAS